MPSKPFSSQPPDGEHQYPEKLKQSSTEENASTWDHVLKIFLNRTMPKIVESVLQSATDLILSPVRKLLLIFGFLIVLVIAYNFYIKPAIARFTYWILTPFRFFSRTIHSLRDGLIGIGHGIAHGASFVGHGLGSGARALGHGAVGIGHGIAHGASFVGHGLGNGARALGHGAAGVGHGIAHGASSVGHGLNSGIGSLFGA